MEKPPFEVQWVEFEEWCDAYIERDPLLFLGYCKLMFAHTYKYWLLSRLTRAGDRIMARGKGAAPAQDKKQTGQWTTFVEIPVSAADEKKISAAYPTAEVVFDDMATLLTEGYRISYAYNEANDAVICTMTCKAEDSPNFGCTVTAFSGDWFVSLKVAMYKHYHIAKGVWRGGEGSPSRPAFG